MIYCVTCIMNDMNKKLNEFYYWEISYLIFLKYPVIFIFYIMNQRV